MVQRSLIQVEELAAERLADALRVVGTDEGMRNRAAILGHAIRSANGVAHAVSAFDDLPMS